MIYLLTGAIRSGKTTALMKWASSLNDVSGIVTPDVNGIRHFLNLSNNEYFNMEANAGEEGMTIGKFTFSKKNFDKANGIIKSAVDRKGWLLVDEIGPLELNGNGFHSSLVPIFKKRNENMIFVVRAGLVDKVCAYFNLTAVQIIGKSQLSEIF